MHAGFSLFSELSSEPPSLLCALQHPLCGVCERYREWLRDLLSLGLHRARHIPAMSAPASAHTTVASIMADIRAALEVDLGASLRAELAESIYSDGVARIESTPVMSSSPFAEAAQQEQVRTWLKSSLEDSLKRELKRELKLELAEGLKAELKAELMQELKAERHPQGDTSEDAVTSGIAVKRLPLDDVVVSAEEITLFQSTRSVKARAVIPPNGTPGGDSEVGAPPSTDTHASASMPVEVNAAATVWYRVELAEDLELSVWSAPLLVTSPAVGIGGSCYLLLLLLLNIVCQVGFATIIHASGMATPDVDDDTVNDLVNWRRFTAQSISHFNDVSRLTLAERVCNGDDSLELSGSQASLHEALSRYLGDDNEGLLGPLMCLLALLAWTMTMVKEILTCIKLLLASMTLPSSREGYTVVEEVNEGESCRITSVCNVTRTFALLSSLIRFGVAGFLMYQGYLYLIYTTQIEDLLLNSVALEFVINLDEAIFEALAPISFRRLIERLEPMRVPSIRAWRGLDMSAAFAFALTASLLATAHALFVLPQTETLSRAKDAICAGELAFVYSVDGIGAPAWAYTPRVQRHRAPDRPWRGDRESDLGQVGYAIDIVLGGDKRAGGRPFQRGSYAGTLDDCPIASCYNLSTRRPYGESQRPNCCWAAQTRVPSVRGGRFSVARKSIESVSTALDTWNPVCSDILDFPIPYEYMVAGAFAAGVLVADPSAADDCDDGACPLNTPYCNSDSVCVKTTCRDAGKYCHKPTIDGVRARQLCPRECGCAAPRSPLALSAPESGCGDNCWRSTEYAAALDALPCEDVRPDDSGFVSFLDRWSEALEAVPLDWELGGTDSLAAIRSAGCSALAPTNASRLGLDIGGNSFCRAGRSYWPVKPFSVWCPVSCGCRSGEPHCPTSCPATESPGENRTDMWELL